MTSSSDKTALPSTSVFFFFPIICIRSSVEPIISLSAFVRDSVWGENNDKQLGPSCSVRKKVRLLVPQINVLGNMVNEDRILAHDRRNVSGKNSIGDKMSCGPPPSAQGRRRSCREDKRKSFQSAVRYEAVCPLTKALNEMIGSTEERMPFLPIICIRSSVEPIISLSAVVRDSV